MRGHPISTLEREKVRLGMLWNRSVPGFFFSMSIDEIHRISLTADLIAYII